MREREFALRTQKIDSRSRRKAKTFSEGRSCSLCGTHLNRYNGGENCYLHSHAIFRKYRARGV